MADFRTIDNNTCVVCFKNVLYYSIGECDHPVCYECSTRMRVLCTQNECPICRQDLSRVVFTDSIQPYKELHNIMFVDSLFERQFKIGFCSVEIKNAFEKLLENCCKLCEKLPPFRSFSALSDHMRKVHERYYCDLCVKHLRIFASERKCYTRQELAHHRRKGDLDDTSHRGHPLCEFCEERFMDADELYRHLRKEHLYCHLCDADGRNYYYASHDDLAHHFRKDHYLCEEGECAGQHLTAVFRSEIDLKAHKASVHGKGLARAAARQARTLELQFNITPHPVAQRPQRSDNASANPERQSQPVPMPSPPSPCIDTDSVKQFPRLSAAPPAPMLLTPGRGGYKGGDGLARNDRNFPALDGGNSSRGVPTTSTTRTGGNPPVAATIMRNSKPSVSIQLHSQPTSASNFRLTQTSGNRISIPPQKKTHLSDDDFPSLAGSIPKDDHPNIGVGSNQPPKVTLINSQELHALKNHHPNNQQSKKPQLNVEAFPALSSASTPTAPPQWIRVAKSKDKTKPSKTEPPPQPKETTFHPVADFPTLPVNVTKPKVKKQPQAQPQPLLQYDRYNPPSQTDNTKINNKKDKKKQNNNIKKDNSIDFSTVNGETNVKKINKELLNMNLYNNNNINTQNTNIADKKIKTTVETSSTVMVNNERKRSSDNGEFAIAPTDYPPLNPKSEAISSKTKSEAFASKAKNEAFASKTKGEAIASKAKSEASASKAKLLNGTTPPGFKARPACDGMTFTNSAGETFPAPLHTYVPPPEFENRNRALVQRFAVALGGTAAVEDFKVASRAFRDGIITADEFYRHCEIALGSQLETVFPELVALLPDIGKQQELVVGREARAQLCVCSNCGQLVAGADRIAHDAAHWPALAPR